MQKEYKENTEKKKENYDLEDDIAEVEVIIEKFHFLLSELDDYNYTYEVNPYKALKYARNESKEPDCELSFKFCASHSRIMNLYRIMLDYVYEAEEKLSQIQKTLRE